MSTELFTATYLTLQILGISSAIHALFTVRTAQGATAWIVGLLSFPLVAVPAYFVFGCRRFDSHARAMEAKRGRHSGLLGRAVDGWLPFTVERSALEPSAAGALAELAGFEFLAGNRLRLLIDGEDTFGEIMREIATARESVYVQFYIVRNDDLGNRLLEAMARRAEAGVKVCFLCDSFGGREITSQVASGPSDGFERCTLFFLQVIGMARQRIWIASPYFVPDESVIQALQLAALRGVEVRILIPQEPDKRLVWLASFQMLLELDHPNLHIHRFTGGFLHHKALVVDEDFAAVGTANFDNRSFRLNFELTLAVADRTFAGEVAAMFGRDFAESRECSAQGYSALSRIDKIGVRIARLLAPVL